MKAKTWKTSQLLRELQMDVPQTYHTRKGAFAANAVEADNAERNLDQAIQSRYAISEYALTDLSAKMGRNGEKEKDAQDLASPD
jgi:hypothetical protein